MTLEQIQQAIAQLSPEDRATLRAWLAQAEASPPQAVPAPESASAETAAEKFGRIAGRTFADLRKRIRES